MRNSIFTEELYDAEELRQLNQAVENEHLEMLTSIVGIYSEMTAEKERDIARVLSILRPNREVPNYRDLLAKARGATGEIKIETPGVKKSYPKKQVDESINLEPAPAG